MNGRRVLLCVTGSIAAYKAVEIARLLLKSGAEVQVAMTEAAQRFVGALSFEAITGRRVLTSVWDASSGDIEHVERAFEVDMVVVAPATANVLARLRAGMADDIVTATLLSTRAPVLIAPAMETGMWQDPATQDNVAVLRSRGVRFVGPATGALASGREGAGRMVEPAEVAAAVAAGFPRDLDGVRFVITAGPTIEALDPVRYLSNRSTGAMGIALASAAARRGGVVTLVLGPTHLPPPAQVTVVRVESADEMLSACEAVIDDVDVLIGSAAVSDFRPGAPRDAKLKRADPAAHRLELVENPDILATLSARIRDREGVVVVGFAAETGDVETNARGKLDRKGCDLVVGNLVGPDRGFGAGDTEVLVVSREGPAAPFGPGGKPEVAEFVLDQVVAARSKS